MTFAREGRAITTTPTPRRTTRSATSYWHCAANPSTRRADTAVTASIIALGRSLDLNVVAEGVETRDQYDHLQGLGCAMAQGYLMHRPAPPDTIGRLLEGNV